MNISDAKKVMMDKVNLEIESVELYKEIRAKEKRIKELESDVREAEYSYSQLENSKIKQFFLGVTGKKETRLQELQNDVRKARAELYSAQFELESFKTKKDEIELTRKEIENTCIECITLIEEVDGEEIKSKIRAVLEVPSLCEEISVHMIETKPLFSQAYNVYRVGEPTVSCLDGNANNRSRAMRKHSKVVADSVDEIIQLLNTYNLYASDEIKIEFHDKWMGEKDYWENQVMPEDSLDRIRKVEDWFFRLEMCWKGMSKQQTATMQKLQEEVLAYLDV